MGLLSVGIRDATIYLKNDATQAAAGFNLPRARAFVEWLAQPHSTQDFSPLAIAVEEDAVVFTRADTGAIFLVCPFDALPLIRRAFKSKIAIIEHTLEASDYTLDDAILRKLGVARIAATLHAHSPALAASKSDAGASTSHAR